MFDLDQAIANWRRQLAGGGIRPPDVLDELESHLREDVEQQVRSGLSEEQALGTAIQRIGQASALKAEFAKTNGTRALQRRLMSILAISLAAFIVWLSAYTFSECEMSLECRRLGFTAIGLALLAAFSWRFAVRFLPVLPNKRARLAAVCGGLFLALVWPVIFGCVLHSIDRFIEPHIERIDSRIILVSLLWVAFPMAVFSGLGIGLGLSESQRKALGMAQ